MKQHNSSSLVLALLAILLVQAAAAATEEQPRTPATRKEQLEVQKLEFEIAALRQKEREWPAWLTAALGLMVGIVGTGASVWVARRSRFAALDQVVHAKRLELYADLVKAMEPLALYFPPRQVVTPRDCSAMGETLCAWYFAGGGLLMSTSSRDAYFCLARALTRASLAAELDKLGVAHTLELFDGTHARLTYRYPGAIRELVLAIAP